MAWSRYSSSPVTVLRREALVIGIAAMGGGAFAVFGAPAAWLSGSMLLITVVGMLKPLPALRNTWFEGTMLFSGTLIGSAATPEAIATVARYPGSLAVMFAGLAAIMLATGAYLRFVGRWSWMDALLAAAPGALAAVISVAQAKGANIGRIAVVQLFRILVLVAVLPSIMQATAPAVLDRPQAVQVATLWEIGLLLGCGLACGLLFRRFGITAPVILGATLSSALLHGFGLVHGTFPPVVQAMVMVVLGALMGGRVAHVSRGELLALFPLAIGGFVVSAAVAFAFAWPASWLAGVPYASAMAAFAPGGLEAMAMLAFAMGLDPLYVGAHHLARFMLLGLAMPLLVVRMKAGPPEE